jgi:adenylosuccinate lyase
MSDFSKYQSPFSWRYGSEELRQIWSEHQKRILWRRIWVALAETQMEFNLVTKDQVNDLRLHEKDVDIVRSLEIESAIKHDLMAEVKVFASQCPVGAGIIHMGATSMDIKDNAEILQIRLSLILILDDLRSLLLKFSKLIEKYAELQIMAFTHLQPAEPTTLGYRLANYAQDLLDDYSSIQLVNQGLKGKGFKGAVGTASSYIELFGKENFDLFEEKMSAALDLPFFNTATQTYSRRQDYVVISQLATLAATINKIAFDFRILQSPPIGELAEPFGNTQIGSSAMPFKRNPIESEKIDSLARLVSSAPQTIWQNAAYSLLERTLDDSANRRSVLPETFLAIDEMLLSLLKILEGLKINENAITRTLASYGPFAGIERLLMSLVKKGADRQQMHARLREHSLHAWNNIENNKPSQLQSDLVRDPEIKKWVTEKEIESLLETSIYTGIAVDRSQEMAMILRKKLSDQ